MKDEEHHFITQRWNQQAKQSKSTPINNDAYLLYSPGVDIQRAAHDSGGGNKLTNYHHTLVGLTHSCKIVI